MTTKYTSDHEWIREDADDCYTVGITDYAQEQLGDVVFVELPEVGRSVESKEAIAVVESVKAASDIFAPLSGEILEANQSLEDAPESLNADAEGAAWLFKIKVSDPAQKAAFAAMMDEQAYKDSVA